MSGKNARRRKRNRAKASYERRLSGVATTAGVLYALPSVVSAAIVHFSGIPVSIDAKAPDGLIPDPETHTVLFDNAVLWDVDGGGTPDFALRRKGTLYTNPIGTEGSAFTNRYAYGYLMLDSATGGNGVVMVNEGTNPPDPLAIQALQAGTQIGPNLVGTLATGSYRLGSAGQTGRNMMNFISSSLLNYTNAAATVTAQAFNGSFNPDQPPGQRDFFGFSFKEGGDTFYGWAAILFDIEGEDRRLEIVEWAYEDTPDTAIAVGATGVPVPAHGLAMLAAGAGSVLAMRRKRRDLALNLRTSDRDTI